MGLNESAEDSTTAGLKAHHRLFDYMAVLPDRALMEMATRLPRTPDAFTEYHGIGPRKLKRYAGLFLDEICAAESA